MKWIPYGPGALLFQFANELGDAAFAKGRAITAELEKHPPPGLTEFVPAFTSVLLEFDPNQIPDPVQIAPELAARLESATSEVLPPAPVKEIPVIYDGPDLARVAEHNRLSRDEVCELHASTLYKVYMLGFAPGFPYLGDLDPRLHTPRLPSPRTRVAAGSVGIGGEHTGIYTVDSPGGWNLIGHTTLRIFDPGRATSSGGAEAMFRLRHGDRVRFVVVNRKT
ncbi:MAG: 5-oxoprolinase subunit PxpB [Verrucomicrobia bacterium]|nr:5-oxoprolinase subunit PxpB [Verrucomicrobiota bacterium]